MGAGVSATQRLAGKTAIVTGAASGIGEAIAIRFLAEGARVLGVDRRESAFDAQLRDREGFFAIAQDVTAPGAPDAIIAAANEKLGGVDILVNNAGVAKPGTLEETGDALWREIMDVNLDAMMRMTRAAIDLLAQSESGRIINLGSIMSDMAGPGLCAYGASKHAVAGLTKSLAVDLGARGVTANYLQPGAIVTALSAPFFEDEAFRRYWEEKAPVGRLGEPADVAAAAVFLASDESAFISGVGLNVDGGAIVKF